MTDHDPAHPGMEAFEPAARRAVAAAQSEAVDLGHDRIGTEHLLLGLLASAGTAAARVLEESGARLPQFRAKVLEALPVASGGQRPSDRSLPLTARAGRALGRSLRFARARRSELVTTEHLLLGVLDVEGTAGQVLRGLGLDVDALRAPLDAGSDVMPLPAAPPPPATKGVRPTAKPMQCPSCEATVTDDLTYRITRTGGAEGDRDAMVFCCGKCGAVLGVSPI